MTRVYVQLVNCQSNVSPLPHTDVNSYESDTITLLYLKLIIAKAWKSNDVAVAEMYKNETTTLLPRVQNLSTIASDFCTLVN